MSGNQDRSNLKAEHDHHASAVANCNINGMTDERYIGGEEHHHRRHHPHMEMPGYCGKLLHLNACKLGGRRKTYIINPVLANPMETLDKQQGHKHDHEAGVELISEHRHRQERFRDGEPGPLAQMGFLNRSQMPKQDFLHSEAKEDGQEHAHVRQDHKAGIAL